VGLLLLFFVLFNTPFIQARLYDYFAQNIEEKYSIKIDSDKFYYNFFSNELTTNFLILDHYNNDMILLPKISVKFENNIFFNSDLIVKEINIDKADFFIKKYDTDDSTNIELFFKKINNHQASTFSSLKIQEINLNDCNLFLDLNKFNKSFTDLDILFTDFLFLNNELVEIDKISVMNQEINFFADLYYNFKNQSWTSNIYENTFNIQELQSNLYGNINFTAKVEGQSNQINLQDFKINYNDSFFDGDIKFHKTQNLIESNVNSLFLSDDIMDFFTSKQSDYKSTLFNKLGSLEYKGNVQFYFGKNFKTDGLIISKYGDINIDLDCVFNSNFFSDLSYQGLIIFDKFKLGEYFQNDLLGQISLETLIEGKGLDSDFKTQINLKEGVFDFNGYSYKNISLLGELSSKYYKGDLQFDDINGAVDFSGAIDFSDLVPKFDFNIDFSDLNFKKLNFNLSDSIKNFSGNFSANLSGTNLNNLRGKLSGSQISYFKHKKESIDNISFLFFTEKLQKNVLLESEIGYGTFTSNLDYNKIYELIKNVFISYFQNKKIDYSGQDFFDLNLVLDDASFFTNLLYSNLDLGKLVISSDYNLDNNYILNANISDIFFDDKYLSNCKLQLTALEENVDCDIFLNNLISQNKTLLDSLYFQVQSKEGDLEYKLNWILKDSLLYSGSFMGDYVFQDDNNILSFKDSKFYLADKLWKINDGSVIHTNNQTFSFKDFSLKSNNEIIYLSGGYDDYLKVYFDFSNFDISLLNFFRKPDASQFSGTLDGTMWYSSKLRPLGAYMKIKDISMNNVLLGEMVINAQSNDIRSSIILDSYIKPFDSHKTLNLNGTFALDGSSNIDMIIDFNGFNPNFLDPLLTSISKPKGKIYGKTRFYGPHDNYFIDGFVTLDSLSFKIPYLNTVYNLDKEYNIFFERDFIFLDTISFFDSKYNTSASFFGNTKHYNAFRNVYYDFNIQSDSMYCLNTNLSNNILYYGDVFAAGNIIISGNPNGVFFDINAISKKGTKFNIPLSYFSDIEENKFIRFIDDKDDDSFNNQQAIENDYSFIMDFDLEITPDAQVRLIYDENIGDVIEGSGFGNLNLKIGEDGFFNIFGDVIIDEGKYLFTMQNIVNKNFKIENGGSLYWDGDPYNADVNFYANYEANTSLNLLDNDYNYNTKLPVICRMHMTEKLLSPQVDFIIDIPNATDVARAKLAQLTDSQQKLLQQFAFLLVSNSFLVEESGEDYLNNSLTVTGTELISNQLSNWLSQTTDDFDLGFKWIPGSSDSLTTDQVEIAFSQKFLNDRLTINGNASNANTPEAQAVTSIVGEVDIQYDLDQSGKIKLTVFNRADAYDPLYGDEFRYEQGLGLFYKKEFNKLFDLFRKK